MTKTGWLVVILCVTVTVTLFFVGLSLLSAFKDLHMRIVRLETPSTATLVQYVEDPRVDGYEAEHLKTHEIIADIVRGHQKELEILHSDVERLDSKVRVALRGNSTVALSESDGHIRTWHTHTANPVKTQ